MPRTENDIAIVGYAQAPNLRRSEHTETEMMLDTVQGAIKAAGLTKDDIGFTVSGSCDYLSGRGFSFVANVDAYGAFPPINESHVEMDGSYAMYEAFVRLLQGDIDTAVAAGVGKTSNSDPSTLYTIEMDPYYLTPLGTDIWSLSALQYRALLDSGKVTERQVAEVVARNRAAARDNLNAQVSGDESVDELLAADYVRNPLRRHDLPPITDGCAAVVLARGNKAYDLCERPVWITGIDHRIEPHLPTMRKDLTSSASTVLAAQGAGASDGPIEVAEIHAPFSFQELILTEALGLGEDTLVNPSGGALGANPVMVTGLLRVIEAAKQISENGKHRTLAHTTSGPCLQQNLVCILEGDEFSHQPVAVVGVGQTHHKKRRADVSIAGLVREAAVRALEDANMDWGDIDAVVMGKAPDLFEGVMKPEMYLADALGANGKPMFRVHTAGSVGGSTGIVGSHLVSSGRHKRVLSVAWEKQSEGNAQFALGGGKSGSIGAGGAFAPFIRAYIRRSGAPEDVGWKVAVKDRLNGAKNPYAHLKLADITIEKVKESPMMWDPLHFLESCPSSDGACAVVFTDEAGGKAASKPPAWVLATAMKSEPSTFAGRDPVNPQAAHDCSAEIYKQIGVTNPREQIDCAELYVPFSWYEPMWLEAHDIAAPGEGWKMTDEGATALDGDFPVNMSGGVLSSNPIGASGLLRFSEAALQVRGQAGDHQVGGAKLAIAQAYGANAQFYAMWAVGSSLDPLGA